MTFANGFAPISRSDARSLILGSMPGQASLAAGQYYAHPRNAFWPIMDSLLAINADAPYDVRTAALRDHGIALWDVLQSCRRPGSLDTAIDVDSMLFNDFQTFFARHCLIQRIFFNGAMAERLFKRHVLPTLPTTLALTCLRLPSTSPAHASLSLEHKRQAWQKALHLSSPNG